ncbi:MAG: protein sphX, partial [Caldilineaceae bacterium]|nr:protein sphX [Caldilineaceae bacterium]
SEDDNILVQGVIGSKYAVGYFGYAYYQENADSLKTVAINGVEATAANVDNASYPLARPLYIYTDAGVIAEKPQVAAFINFYLTYVNEEIERVGYFPAESSVLEAARQSLLIAIKAVEN